MAIETQENFTPYEAAFGESENDYRAAQAALHTFNGPFHIGDQVTHAESMTGTIMSFYEKVSADILTGESVITRHAMVAFGDVTMGLPVNALTAVS